MKEEHKRLYPSYHISELKSWVKEGKLDPETNKKVLREIVARETGTSKVKVTPQIEGGKVKNKVGRM